MPRAKFGSILGLGWTLLAAGLTSAFAAPSVYVAYPKPEYRVAFDHVILEGSVTAGASLKVDGQAVQVASDGLFMLWWPLKVGVNDLKLVVTQGGQSGSTTVRVIRTSIPAVPATPTAIAKGSVLPKDNIEFWDAPEDSPEERTVQISFRGSAGGRATFHVGGGPLQPMREGPAGTYTGSYQLPEQASLRNAAITVHLTGRDGKTVNAAATGRLSSTLGNLKTGVQKQGTIQGQGLNDAQNYATTLAGDPALFPRSGMTFKLVGRVGTDVRARLASGVSVLLSANQLNVMAGPPPLASSGSMTVEGAVLASLPTPAAPAPVASAAAPALPSALPSGSAVAIPAIPSTPPDPAAEPAQPAPSELVPVPTPAPTPAPAVLPAPVLSPPSLPAPSSPFLRVRVPLGGAKVAFLIDQTGPSQLTLTLFGLLNPPTPPSASDPLITRISVNPALGQTKVVFDLNTAQLWGFTANYEGQDLLLSVRRPPVLDSVRPLRGRTITIDPGHGGTQTGGAGSFGIPEKNIVLPIALRVAELLRAQGATVNMTRTGDTTLGLYERDLSAEASGSDLLVSIHANALPDGRNPAGIRGPEVHFTHPQAQPVSAAILAQLRSRLPELGAGKGLMEGANLALTRPTTQPSLLVETAYLTDPSNLRTLSSADGKERFAQAIAGGIVDFYRAQK